MVDASQERWVFDLGNTRLKCARLQRDGKPGPVLAIGHGQRQEELMEALATQVPRSGLSACLASVAAPALTAAVVDVLQARFRVVSLARTQASLDGLQVAYAAPEKLGVDRFLAMVGARTRGSGPWLVAGVGTALTIDVIASDGRHLGGRIAPSPQLMRQALHRAAVQLPVEGGLFNEFASDTPDALASGCEGAAVALIERSLAHATTALGVAPGLLLHGGGIEPLLPRLAQARRADGLVLEGLAVWSAASARPPVAAS